MQVVAPRHYSRWLRSRVPTIVAELPSLKHAKGVELTSLLLREADSESVASLLLEVRFDVHMFYCCLLLYFVADTVLLTAAASVVTFDF